MRGAKPNGENLGKEGPGTLLAPRRSAGDGDFREWSQARVERTTSSDMTDPATMQWEDLGEFRIDGDHRGMFEDRLVPAGRPIGYRARVETGSGELVSEIAWITPGALRLALTLPRQPVRAGDRIRVTLADRRAATLELFDVRGRRLWWERLSPGSIAVQERELPDGLVRGVAWLKLTQGELATTARLVVL